MLTDYQKSSARHDGGKPLANRKAHLSRVLAALVDLHNGGGAIHDLTPRLTPNEIASLREAANILAGLVMQHGRDVKEAKRIKDAHEQAIRDASQAVAALITDPVADVVALAAVSGDEFHRPHDIAAACERTTRWAMREIEEARRSALSILAYKIVKQHLDPSAYCAGLALSMQAERMRHVDTIARIKAVLVQAELERAA